MIIFILIYICNIATSCSQYGTILANVLRSCYKHLEACTYVLLGCIYSIAGHENTSMCLLSQFTNIVSHLAHDLVVGLNAYMFLGHKSTLRLLCPFLLLVTCYASLVISLHVTILRQVISS